MTVRAVVGGHCCSRRAGSICASSPRMRPRVGGSAVTGAVVLAGAEWLAITRDWDAVGKIKAGVAAPVVVLLVFEWLVVSHTLSWALSALMPR